MIRHYWREVSFAVIVGLPLFTLLPLGFLWLQERNWLAWWAGGAALAGVAAFGLRLAIARAMRRGGGMRAEEIAPPSPEWRAHERAAWELVERQAEGAEPLSAEAWPALRQRLEATVDVVARHFRPDAAQARWRITVPEALLLGERIARDLRRVSLTYLPGAEHLQLAHLFQARDFYERHGETAKKAFEIAWTAKRFASLAANPAAALFNELKDLLAGEVSGHLTRRLRCDFAQILVRETGRAAIDLYAGRLRLDPAALQALADERPRAPTDLAAPVRLLLAGQAGAGKSSLLNALAGKAQRQVKGTLTHDGSATLQVQREGKPEVTITDLPGLGDDRRGEKELDRHIDDADMLVWVVSATEPARAVDVEALKRLRAQLQAQPERRFPPLLVAVTHIDRVPPQREWAPPYDLLAADRPKAQAIRAALDHIADILAVERERIVPVMARSLEQAYNIDLLWESIAANIDAARFTQLDRLHRKSGEFSLSRAAAQAGRASAFLARRLLGRG